MQIGHSSPPPAVRRHLVDWIGGWPPEQPVNVVASRGAERPGWDGKVHRATGAVDPDGNAVVGVARSVADALARPIADVDDLRAALPAAIGRRGVVGLGALR